jgi:hypothetical protein
MVESDSHTERPDERGESVVQEVASGRSAGAPFLLLGSVALTVWTVAAVAVLLALLAWWLT